MTPQITDIDDEADQLEIGKKSDKFKNSRSSHL